MPGKMARSTPRPAFGLRELLVAIHTSRQSCYEAGKARIFTPVRESSGESRLSCVNMGSGRGHKTQSDAPLYREAPTRWLSTLSWGQSRPPVRR